MVYILMNTSGDSLLWGLRHYSYHIFCTHIALQQLGKLNIFRYFGVLSWDSNYHLPNDRQMHYLLHYSHRCYIDSLLQTVKWKMLGLITVLLDQRGINIMIFISLFVEVVCFTIQYMIYQYCLDPVLIQQISLGLEAIQLICL